MNSQTKTKFTLKLATKTSNDNIIYGKQIRNIKNNQNCYTQHFYSLFILLYYNGEISHRELIISKAEQCRDFHLSHLTSFKNKGIQCSEHCQFVKYIIESLAFLIDTLQKRTQAQKINQFCDIFKLWNGVVAIYELENGEGSSQKDEGLVHLAKMTASLLRIKCIARNFQDFSLIQFTCSHFKNNNIQVYIEINKQKSTYRYIKQIKQPQAQAERPYLMQSDDGLSSDSCDSLTYIRFRFLESEQESVKQASDFYEQSFALKSIPQSPRRLRNRSISPSISHHNMPQQTIPKQKAQNFNLRLFKVKQSQNNQNIANLKHSSSTCVFSEQGNKLFDQQISIRQSSYKQIPFFSKKCSQQTQNSINNISPIKIGQSLVRKFPQQINQDFQQENKSFKSALQLKELNILIDSKNNLKHIDIQQKSQNQARFKNQHYQPNFSEQKTNILTNYLINTSQINNQYIQNQQSKSPKSAPISQINNIYKTQQKQKREASQTYAYPQYIKYQSIYCTNKYRKTIN